ncbi:MAG: trypsin-like peptidase domain-containing protein [Candidatus Liptonbacteria bacterium]
MEPQKKPGLNKIFIVAVAALLVAGFTQSTFVQASAGSTLRDWLEPLLNWSVNRAATIATSTVQQVPLYKPVLDYEKAVVDAVKKASPAVVSITVSKNVPIIERCPGTSPFSDLPPEFQQFFGGDLPQITVPCQKGTQMQEVGGGSGFVIQQDGLILTNRHVVSDIKASYTVFTNDGNKYDATVLARDPIQDLAVLKINATGLPTVDVGDSDSLELGQTAIAIGNALGEFRNTVSVGVISGLARTVTAQGGGVSETIHGVIQTDSAINPGNSGGPLLNLRGEVVGINTAIVSGAQNIGFAIPINRAKKDITSVKANGKIEAPYLGIRYVAVNDMVQKQEKLAYNYGVLVQGGSDGPGVVKGSPADKAGVKEGDVILELNGAKIDSNHSFIDLVSDHSVGETIGLKVLRGSNEMNLSLVLAARPTD